MHIETTFSEDKKNMTIRLPERFTFEMHGAFRKAYEIEADFSAISLDLARTQYMDSSALGMMLQLKEKSEKKNRKVKVVNVSANVLTILKIAKFDQLFTIQ